MAGVDLQYPAFLAVELAVCSVAFLSSSELHWKVF